MTDHVVLDLHMHSTASDGDKSPTKLVELVAASGVTHFALTDHDTIDGVEEALEACKAYPQLNMVPGVEVSCQFGPQKAHVLLFFPDGVSAEARQILDTNRINRIDRAKRMCQRFTDNGLDITYEQVISAAPDASSVGRPHLARALLAAGVVSTVDEAFTHWLSDDGPIYEPLPSVRGEDILKVPGALACIAHPFEFKMTRDWLRENVPTLHAQGLWGLEVVHSGSCQIEGLEAFLIELAREHGMGMTIGSDHHGDVRPDFKVGIPGRSLPDDAIEKTRHDLFHDN